MKFGWIFEALLLISILPIFVNSSLQCEDKRLNIYKGYQRKSLWSTSVSCLDACVQFKCIVEDDVIITGAGCYQVFENLCRYVPTQVKNKIQTNLNFFGYADASLIFASQNVSNGAQKAYDEMVKLNPNAELKFAAHLKTQWNGKNYVRLRYGSDETREIQSSLKCGTYTKTSKFLDVHETPEFTENKICDECVAYKCTSADGTKIISGSGCFEDFVRICETVNGSDRELVKENIKNSFHYGPNFVVASCSHEKNCAERELQRFLYINKDALDSFAPYINRSSESLKMQDQPRLHRISNSASSNFQGYVFGVIVALLIFLW